MTKENVLKVLVDLSEGSDKDREENGSLWRARVYDKTESEMVKLWEDYNKKYYNDEFDGAWIDYLESENVKYEEYDEEYDLFLEQM